MQIKLNAFTVLLLRVILFPVAMVLAFFEWVTGAGKKPAYLSTIQEHPLEYRGDRPLVIAVWATWASVWSSTLEAITQVKDEFAGRCEFCFVEATGNDVAAEYQVEIVPTVIVRHKGKEVARLVNLMDADELRKAVAKCVAESA